MCLGVVLFGSTLFRILWAYWACMSLSFIKVGKFSFIIFSNKFSISCSFSSPGTPMIQMLECLKLSQRFLNLSSFFKILISSFVLSECLLFPCVPNCWFEPQLLSVHCWFLYIFLYFTLHSLHFFLYFLTIFNHFCEHPDYQCLNSASDRLSICLSLSSVFGALICSFIWAIFLCLGAPVKL